VVEKNDSERQLVFCQRIASCQQIVHLNQIAPLENSPVYCEGNWKTNWLTAAAAAAELLRDFNWHSINLHLPKILQFVMKETGRETGE
jgi:hypothetical protein